MDSGNSVCQECQRNAPDVFCQCSTPEITLCTGCIGRHIVKSSQKSHETRLIGELPYYKIPGYFKRLDTRKEVFTRVKEQALSSIDAVDKALNEYYSAVERVAAEYTTQADKEVQELQQRIAQIITQADSVIYRIRAKAEEETAKLMQIKRDLTREVQAALEEVERTLNEEKPKLRVHYSPVFRQITETYQPFSLFSYCIHTSQEPVVTVTTDIQDSFPPPAHLQGSPRPTLTELAQVTTTSLRIFNCQSLTWGPQVRLNIKIQEDQSSIWMILEDGRLFCSGGGK